MPYVAGSDAAFVKLGPGKLYFGAVGATEPTDLATAIVTGTWSYAGFTEEGSTFTLTPTYDAVEVAESLLPIARTAAGQELTVAFNLAELTAQNLQRVMNGATITSSGTGASSIDSLEPLAFGTTETRVAILWVADDNSERWVFRKCLQTGAVAIGRRKGSAKAVIPATFTLEPVSASTRPFKAILKATASIT